MLFFKRIKNNLILFILILIASIIYLLPNIHVWGPLNSFVNFYQNYLHIKPITLGLDLKGGIHFLIKLDTNITKTYYTDTIITKIKKYFKKKNSFISLKSIIKKKNTIVIELYNNTDFFIANKLLKKKFHKFNITKNKELNIIKLKFKNIFKKKKNILIKQTMDVLKNRIYLLGITDYKIQQQGKDKINIELPGIQNIKKVKKILKKIATIDFNLINEYMKKEKLKNLNYSLSNKTILTGDSIIDAQLINDNINNHLFNILIKIHSKNLTKFKNITKKNIGKPLAIIYKEIKEKKNKKFIEKKIINIARIMTTLGEEFQITGLKFKEAKELLLILKSGALPTNLTILEEYVIGPSLGKQNINKGIQAVILASFFLFIASFFLYNVFGLITNILLCFNLLFLLFFLNLFNITLTLYGIAGIVLTLGMAIDANVLIFEKIKDLMKNNKEDIQIILNKSYYTTINVIIDSNLTTLIVGIILYILGTPLLKSFSITLCLGIISSFYTSTICLKTIFTLFFENKKCLLILPLFKIRKKN